MGFLNKLRGKADDLPVLDPDIPEHGIMEGFRKHVKVLLENVEDSIEVLPYNDKAYVFIGKPPKKFGFMWIDDKYINNLKGVVKEKGLSTADLGRISEDIRNVYLNNSDMIKKYSWNVDNAQVVAISSDSLGKGLQTIVEGIQ